MNEEELNPYRPPAFNPSDSADNSKPEKSEFDECKLVVLAEFVTSIEAHGLRNMLADNGIESQVTNEQGGVSFGLLAGTSRSFSPSVMIREEDSEAGLAIKQEYLSADFADSSEVPEWVCRCGETVDAGFEVCWNCEASFGDPAKGPKTPKAG